MTNSRSERFRVGTFHDPSPTSENRVDIIYINVSENKLPKHYPEIRYLALVLF